MTLKKANYLYCFIEGLHFICQSLIFNFASAYMLSRGYSNTVIGVILFLASLLSIFLMQIVAYVEKVKNISVNIVSVILASLIFVLGGALYFLNLSRILVCVALCIVVTCNTSLERFVGSLYRGYYDKGLKINYSIARGFGSLAFAMCSLITGRIFANRPLLILPSIYSFFALILVILLLIFNAPNVEKKEEEAKQSLKDLLKEYPHFTVYLVAVFFSVWSSIFISTFMLQIMQGVGGGIKHAGTALFVGAILEFPAMIIYKRLSDKIGNRRLLVISMTVMTIKHLLISLIPSPIFICCMQVLQIMSYGMYVPSSERHIAHVVPSSFYLRAQALVSSAGFASNIVAFLIGGILIDSVGIFISLLIIDGVSILSVVFVNIAIKMSYKRIPKTVR